MPAGGRSPQVSEEPDMKCSSALLLPMLLLTAAVANADCVYPQAPQSLPNGTKAAKEDMLAAQAQVKEYSAAVQETYLPCLDKEKTDYLAALDSMDPEYTAKKTAIEAVHAKKHNAALDELQAIAGRWSEELKAYKAASQK
jgi:hypothetical protein